MKFQIKHRWNASVLFECELTPDLETASPRLQRGFAIKEAIKDDSNLRDSNLRDSNLSGSDLRGSNLRGSDLSGSDLSDSNLRDSNLRDSNLSGSNLRGSDLRDSNLRGSDLRGSDLSGSDLRGSDLSGSNLSDSNLSDSNLSGSNLRGSDLRGSDLRGSDLRGSNLRGSDLSGSDLRGSDLSGSNLSGSNLSDSNLSGSNLTPIRDDLWAVLSSAPAEVEGLRAALIAGKVDGSTYNGDCACLVGTIANIRHQGIDTLGALQPNSARPAERFFLGINRGDTPDMNQVSLLAVRWIDEWLFAVRSAFGPKEADAVEAP